MKKIEIERRFLLKREPDLTQPYEKIFIRQYYNATENGVERWRESQSSKGITYERIIKKTLEKGINEEDHLEVDYISFLNTIQKVKNLKYIIKERIVYEFNGLKFEIDIFGNGLKLVICEVELENINQEITFPDFIKSIIIKEITGEKEFSNYNLAE